MKSHFKKATDRFSVELKIAPDGLKMFLDVLPKGTPAVSREELLTVLNEKISPEGLDLGVIDDIVRCINKGEEVKERRIKKGREPEPGTGGKLLLLVKKFTGKGDYSAEEGKKISLTQMHLFDNISVGQVVGRLYPPKPGRDGVDVLDKKIPAPVGEAPKVTFDKTISIEESAQEGERFQKLIACAAGYLSEEGGTLGIKEELLVKGDLDFHYGSINFVGSVKITGDVSPGFSVTANKGIVVNGSVQRAKLVSSQGGIEIHGHVFGGEEGAIVCAQDLKVKVITQIRAEVGGAIFIEKESTDSNLRSQTMIQMEKGVLIGGRSMAVCGVEAREIGNSAGKETTIELCSDIEVSPEYEKLCVLIENHEKASKLLELHLGPLANNPTRISFLKEPHKGKMEKLSAKLLAVKQSTLKLVTEKKALLERGKVSTVSRVNVKGVIHPGAVLIAKDKTFVVQEPVQGPLTIEFDREKEEFVQSELKALECTIVSNEKSEGKGTTV